MRIFVIDQSDNTPAVVEATGVTYDSENKKLEIVSNELLDIGIEMSELEASCVMSQLFTDGKADLRNYIACFEDDDT